MGPERNFMGRCKDFVLKHPPIQIATSAVFVRVALLTIFLHVSQGLFFVLGYPLPYESPLLRLTLSALCLVPLTTAVRTKSQNAVPQLYVGSLMWLNIPVFGAFMYLQNNGAAPWFMVATFALLLYFSVITLAWATAGLVSGIAAGYLAYILFGNNTFSLPADMHGLHLFLFLYGCLLAAFCGYVMPWLTNLRLNSTLASLGMIAHELRTPLSSLSLMVDVLEQKSREIKGSDALESAGINESIGKMRAVLDKANSTITMQIEKARGDPSSGVARVMSAAECIRESLSLFPFNTQTERNSVTLLVTKDFQFVCNPVLFGQVIDNLLKNSLRAVRARDQVPGDGDIVFEVGSSTSRGFVRVSDKGTGIPEDIKEKVFSAFFTTSVEGGHGLGLAFCKRVIYSAKGSIAIEKSSSDGTTFIIDLPVQPPDISAL